MERYEMAELLSKKAGVSLEEARAALEENNWDLLDAMIALERAHKTAQADVNMRSDAEAGGVRRVKNISSRQGPRFFSNGFAVLWEYLKKLVRITLDNNFVVTRHGKQTLTMPVLVMIVLFFASFGLMLVVLIAGLFCSCRYHFEGRQLGKDGINSAMDKMSDFAEDIKDSFQNGRDGGRNG